MDGRQRMATQALACLKASAAGVVHDLGADFTGFCRKLVSDHCTTRLRHQRPHEVGKIVS